MSETTPALLVSALMHVYAGRDPIVFPDFALPAGEAMALLGPSGSGKTTLLLLLAGLLAPRTGIVRVAGTQPASLAGAARDRWRGRTVGVVLQSFGLLPRLTVRENLLAAHYCAGLPSDPVAVEQTLAMLDLVPIASAPAGRLSRGQMQRAAIARAVVNRPAVILADEPTSSLDDAAAERALRLLQQTQARLGAALLIATHDRRVRASVPQTLELAAA